jgi:ribose transport system ATP-binding protein
MHPRRGVIRRPGGELRPGVRQAIKSGLAYVPEDRNEDAAFADLSIANNTAASHDGDYFRSGRHDGRAERSYAREVIARLGVKAQGADVPVGTLSGGNQQKVMIGRWLRPGTKVLLLDEPTQGVDVGARADIYREIGRLREEGLGIVLVSSDDEELLGLADTVVVLRRGSVACIRPRVAIDAKALSHFVHGLNPEEEDGS